MKLTFSILAIVLAGSASAQGIRFSPEATETCLEAQTDPAARAACVGKSAQACYDNTPNASEIEQAVCLNSELEWWSDRLDTAYAAMEKRAAFLDIDFAKAISQGGAKMTDDLAAMQAAWKDWSVKRCIFAATQRRGKEDRTVVASDCLLRLTAEQTLLLETAAESKPRR